MIKNINEILIDSIRAVSYNIKFVILFWLTNTAFAIVLSVPIYNLLLNDLKNSLMSDKLSSGFDYFWYLQFRNLYEISLDQIPWAIFTVAGIYTIIQTFYLGGLISVFNQFSKNHYVDFFYGGVKYFFRFFKVLLISLIFYSVAFLLNDLIGDLITIVFRNTEFVKTEFLIRFLRYTFLLFLIGIITLISDYSKVSLALKDKTKVIQEIIYATKFIQDNFSLVFLVFLFIAFLGALGSIVYNLLVIEIPRTPYYFLIGSFILQQMLIIFRLLIRMLFCSSEVILFKDLAAGVIQTEEKEEL
ncbi:MAG: hypothetical protein QHH13_04845 [Melioribacter sp.]|uniref:hypothetical protein n=1 Tax=Rosettibacter primus TaxID=3111523 RepID=UPI00247E669A|nr:hypothetical protein [Melioribacter sp.]